MASFVRRILRIPAFRCEFAYREFSRTMLSQFLSFVGDFNNEDEEEYDSDSVLEEDDHGVGRVSEMETIRQELAKYVMLPYVME